MQKNLEFKTELFKGVNPVYIPYFTDQKDYEDKYIHNQQQLLDHPSKEELLTANKHPLLDVDFIKNLQLNDMPTGYGTYQSQNEIAIELERFTKMSNADEMKRATQKEMDSKIFARKVISKINHNSQRIIETN